MSEPWDTKAIGECLQTSFAGEWGGAPNPPNARVYRATDIDDEGRIIGEGAERRLPRSKLDPRQLIDGDILLEGSGGGPDKPVGRVAYFDAAQHPGSAVCSNFFKTLRPKRDVVDPRFLFRKLLWFYKQPELLAFQQQTTGIINLKFSEYLESSIDIPESIKEQAKIAKVLETLDTTIAQTESIIAKLKAVKHGLLHDLLTRGIDANGELRPPQSEAPQLYKPSVLGWIPREWNVSSIETTTTNSVIGPFGSDLVASDYRESGVPVVFVRDVKPNSMNWISNVYVSPQKAMRLAAHEVCPGDVVATKMGFPPCIAAVYPDSLPNGIVTADIVRLKIARDKVRSKWLAYSMNSWGVARQVEKITAGVTRPKVTLRDVRDLEICLPSLTEQDVILARWEALEARSHQEECELEKLTKAKSGLLDDLLTGNVRVTALLR